MSVIGAHLIDSLVISSMSQINTLPKAHFFSMDIIGTSYKRNPLKKCKIFDFGQKVCRKLERNVPTRFPILVDNLVSAATSSDTRNSQRLWSTKEIIIATLGGITFYYIFKHSWFYVDRICIGYYVLVFSSLL